MHEGWTRSKPRKPGRMIRNDRWTCWGLLVAFLHGIPADAQRDSVAMRYASTITQADLRRHLEVIADDEFEGRETGRAGQRKAATYLREQFTEFGIGPVPDAKSRGLVNGYEQSFDLEVTSPGGLGLVVDGSPRLFLTDYFYFSDKLRSDLGTQELLFAGRGITDGARDDYAGTRAAGRVVLVIEGDHGRSIASTEEFFADARTKSKAAEAAGAGVLLIASTRIPGLVVELDHFLKGGRMQLAPKNGTPVNDDGMQVLFVSREVGETLLASAGMSWRKALKFARKPPRAVAVDLRLTFVDRSEKLSSTNVLAYVEGTDKKDELVVVTAHYDHIGVMDGEVYNGADDDGSGTVALLEMAQAFAQARARGDGPRRSVLFMPVSGEEKGLLGSEHYSENPVFPLENTVADLNIDMIGRLDSAHADGLPYVYIIGSDRLSTELHQINAWANDTYVGLDLDETFNAHDDPNRFYYRSDHYNFARKGIPVIFYFSGVHEDYHGPKDEVDRIRFDLLEPRARLVFHTAWILANRDERIVVDGKAEAE